MPVDEASEAQRLIFGHPQTVRTQFASQISTCWFDGAGPLNADYSFTMPDRGDNESGPLLIRVFGEAPERAEVFQIQFYPHNNNTVVATRNFALPATLSDELERSVELWLLDPAQCRRDGDRLAASGAALPPAQQTERLQLPPLDNIEHRGAADAPVDEDMHQAELRARGAI